MKKKKTWGVTNRLTGILMAGTLVLSEAAGLLANPIITHAEEISKETVLEDDISGMQDADGIESLESAEAGETADETASESAREITGETADNITDDPTIIEEETDAVDADNNIFGDKDVNKDKYYVTFTVNNDGTQKTWTKELIKDTKKPLNEYGFYNELLGESGEINTFVKESDSKTRLVGWSVYTDGFNATDSQTYIYTNSSYSPVYLNADAYTYDNGSTFSWNEEYGYEEYAKTTQTFMVSGNKDYHFVAHIAKAAAENMYVSAIPSVYYNGLQHMAIGTSINSKKQAADLRIMVFAGEEGWLRTQLIPDVDYTLSYKNNTEASMKLIRDGDNAGNYVPISTDISKRPTVVVTGKGTYTGFSAEAYFDILPSNIGEYEYVYDFLDPVDEYEYDSFSWNDPYTYTGKGYAFYNAPFKASYILKNGKVSGIPKQKVTRYYYTEGNDTNGKMINKYYSAKVQLTEGKDYCIELYKWNDTESCWTSTGLTDPSKITEKGDYLALIRGIGNYCGAYYGSGYSANYDTETNKGNDFNKGDNGVLANPAHNLTNNCQFRVTDDQTHDLTYAKMTIKKKSVKWSGSPYDAAAFQISVKDKKGKTLELGKDYYVNFSPAYVKVGKSTYQPRSQVAGVTNGSQVSAAAVYNVTAIGKGDYFGTANKTNGVRINGLKLKPSFFKLESNKITYGSPAKWSITPAGAAQKLTMDSTSDYYVGSGYVDGVFSSAKKKVVAIGGPYRCGNAIDPSSIVKLSYKYVSMELKEAISKGLIKFEVAENGEFNVGGAVPEYIKVTGTYENEYRPEWPDNLYPGAKLNTYVNNAGSCWMSVSFRDNSKVNDKATVTVKAISGPFTGTADIGTFIVQEKKVEYLSSDYNSWDLRAYGRLRVDIVSQLQSKGSIDRPVVALYQSGRDMNGNAVWQPVGSDYYSAANGGALGEKSIACNVLLNKGSKAGFDFGESGLYTYEVFGLYANEIKSTDIKSVRIDDKDYTVANGAIQNYAAVFTGETVIPNISRITLSDGTELDGYGWDFYTNAKDGTNITAGKGKGELTIRFCYHREKDRFPYGLDVTLKFDITDSKGIKM